MRLLATAALALLAAPLAAQSPRDSLRPFGTLREQAALRQFWLEKRMETVLPALMRKHGVDMWVVPMREYNEDPVFSSIVAPTTFAARRRTIYVFFDRGPELGVERIAFGGGSQGGVYRAVRATKKVEAPPAGGNTLERTAELWGDEQWTVLHAAIEERRPRAIAVDISRTFAFSDGLSAGELEGMTEALGPDWTKRLTRVERLPLELIATRLPDEAPTFRAMNELAWRIIGEAFSSAVITPGVTRTEDVEWWMLQRLNDLGLRSWFQPSVSVQRRGRTAEQVGENPVIERGDLLHCDFGITALGLNTDTQHMGYVLREGETDAPAGLKRALAVSNRLQDIVVEEIRPGRTGNEILRSARARMRREGIDGSIYSHPVGMHGHGAGPLIGLWDHQDGVPGRGDVPMLADTWFSIELRATTAVPEWDGQRVFSAQEEDIIIDGGVSRWALRRQTELHLVR